MPLPLSYQGPRFTNRPDGPRHLAEGDLLVIEKGADLPPHCVLCDADAPHPHPLVTARWGGAMDGVSRDTVNTPESLLGPLLGARLRVRLGLCPRHLRRRRVIAAVARSALALGAAMPFLAFSGPTIPSPWSEVAIGLIVFACVSLVYLATAHNVLEPIYLDHGMAKFRGASPAFLKRLGPKPVTYNPPPPPPEPTFDIID